MIKSLKEARIADGLPRILAKQPWVQALSEAMGVVHEMTMDFADHSQIYTGLDYMAEDVLDAMAVNWKIDWYNSGYSIEQKRQIIKTALMVRRTMGTVAAVKEQAGAIYPGSNLAEWFEYGGTPGCFRIEVNDLLKVQRDKRNDLFRAIDTVKRASAHMDGVYLTDRPVKRLSEAIMSRTILRKTACAQGDAFHALTWLADGAGNPLADRNGNILCI